MYLNQAESPVEVTPEMVDFYRRTYGTDPGTLTTIPGTNMPVNIQPAQTQLTNVLIYLAVAAALLMLYRRR